MGSDLGDVYLQYLGLLTDIIDVAPQSSQPHRTLLLLGSNESIQRAFDKQGV